MNKTSGSITISHVNKSLFVDQKLGNMAVVVRLLRMTICRLKEKINSSCSTPPSLSLHTGQVECLVNLVNQCLGNNSEDKKTKSKRIQKDH